jgi:hypothetical protein
MAKKKRKKTNQSTFFSDIVARFSEMFLNIFRAWVIYAVVLLLSVSAVLMIFWQLERYVDGINHIRPITVQVKMKSYPSWAGSDLIHNICLTTGIDIDHYWDDDMVVQMQARLSENPWVKSVNLIQRHYDGLVEINCELRKPVARIIHNGKSYCVGLDGILLPDAYVLNHLVTIEGVDVFSPHVGHPITSRPMIAGLDILDVILGMESGIKREQRIWQQLRSINVNNYKGRINPSAPHFCLYTGGNTEIRWGADVDSNRAFYEVDYANKVSTLYRHNIVAFSEGQTLDRYKYIDLRDFRKSGDSDPVRYPDS